MRIIKAASSFLKRNTVLSFISSGLFVVPVKMVDCRLFVIRGRAIVFKSVQVQLLCESCTNSRRDFCAYASQFSFQLINFSYFELHFLSDFSWFCIALLKQVI